MRHVRSAVLSAVELLNMPSRVRLARLEPLPADVGLLLRLAAGDGDADTLATGLTERPVEFNRRAAAFFIEQILLSPESDSYRILGGSKLTPVEDLRRNMALLVRWLHPDIETAGERSIFVKRVTAAWEDLKTPERRLAYDAAREEAASTKATVSTRQNGRRPKTGSQERHRIDHLTAPPGVRGIWPRMLAYMSSGWRSR